MANGTPLEMEVVEQILKNIDKTPNKIIIVLR